MEFSFFFMGPDHEAGLEPRSSLCLCVVYCIKTMDDNYLRVLFVGDGVIDRSSCAVR
jgi:hypothetical protein